MQNKRIFIGDLPDNIEKKEIELKFKNYGEISNVEVLERKILKKGCSKRFAFINLYTDDFTLQKCFQDIMRKKWKGNYVELQMARESFLERLKKEREGNKSLHFLDKKTETLGVLEQKNFKRKSTISDNNAEETKQQNKPTGENTIFQNNNTRKVDLYNKSEKIIENNKNEATKHSLNVESYENFSFDEDGEIIIKHNKNAFSISNKKFKIKPEIFVPIKKIKDEKFSNKCESELKRLQALNRMKKEHQLQKNILKTALSLVDMKPFNKIIFDGGSSDKEEKIKNQDPLKRVTGKLTLFKEESGDEESNYHFEVKEHFIGKKGQELMKLQRKTKNDERFKINEKFLEEVYKKDSDEGEMDEIMVNRKDEELNLEEEKLKELGILEEVLGKKIMRRDLEKNEKINGFMVRYDPENPEHLKYELKSEGNKAVLQKKRIKLKSDDDSLDNEIGKGERTETKIEKMKKVEENKKEKYNGDKNENVKNTPKVSKEKFYKITEDLRDSFKENKFFSLLSTFEKNHKDKSKEFVKSNEQNLDDKVQTGEELKRKNFKQIPGKNPFRYDSSDDDEEIEVVGGSEENSDKNALEEKKSWETRENNPSLKGLNLRAWNEPFFFKKDDYRFQEGLDFVKKMSEKFSDKNEFLKIRRNLKEVVKAKVKNNLKKKNPFRKKLSVNARKKILRKKKALRR